MAHDHREIANEIDRLLRVGYVGRDLLSRLATKYPSLTHAELNVALEETKAMLERRERPAKQIIAGLTDGGSSTNSSGEGTDGERRTQTHQGQRRKV